jgi:cytochrome b5
LNIFFFQHPGGDDILLEYAGRDATLAFRGSGHSEDAIKLLEKFEIGELPLHECIFRCKNGLKLKNLPN